MYTTVIQTFTADGSVERFPLDQTAILNASRLSRDIMDSIGEGKYATFYAYRTRSEPY